MSMVAQRKPLSAKASSSGTFFLNFLNLTLPISCRDSNARPLWNLSLFFFDSRRAVYGCVVATASWIASQCFGSYTYTRRGGFDGNGVVDVSFSCTGYFFQTQPLHGLERVASRQTIARA
jgi:hypothetical protein